MGIITGIRKRGALMIILIGIATGGFIIMDVVQNQNMSASAGNIGSVEGVTLDFNEMRSMEEILYQGSDADEYSKETISGITSSRMLFRLKKPRMLG
jgi:hypothetical protein